MLDKLLGEGTKKVTEFVEKRQEVVQKELEEKKRNKELQEQAEKEKKELRELSKCVFELLREELQQKALDRKAENQTQETVVLGASHYDFDSLGYPYNTLVVGQVDDNTVLEVEYKGVTYNRMLKAGLNHINVLHGSRLRVPNKTVIAVLVRHTNQY